MKIRKSTFFLLAILLGTVLMIRYTLRDINLDIDLLREGLERMPGIVLEDIEFEREINGELWYVKIPFAQRIDLKTEVRSVDVRRWRKDGQEWYLKSEQGFFQEDTHAAELKNLLGTLETGARVLNLESPTLLWTEGDEEFLFPDGLTLFDTEFILNADVASIDEAGVILLDKGGTIRWTKDTWEDS